MVYDRGYIHIQSVLTSRPEGLENAKTALALYEIVRF